MEENELVIKRENIIYGLESKDIKEIISELTEKLYSNGDINNKSDFFDAVLERENEIPTSIGNEMAIPHGKSESVEQSTVALCVLSDAIKWGGDSQDDVKYVFLLAIKKADKGEKYLKTLANLSSKLMDSEFVSSLKAAGSNEELFNVINNI